MPLSPKQYVSHMTGCTSNRGVSVKEIEIANTRLDVHASSVSGPPPTAPPVVPPLALPHQHPPAPCQEAPGPDDDSNSYIQVEVRRGRLPTASSPAQPPAATPHPPPPVVQRSRGEGGMLLMPLLTCAGNAAPQWCRAAADGEGGAMDACAAGDACASKDDLNKKTQNVSLWRKISEYAELGDHDGGGCGEACAGEEAAGAGCSPERVEVYYFERSCGAWLATSDGARQARVDQWAGRVAQRGRALLAEALAAARLLAEAPIGVALEAERALLVVARGAALGALQTAADYALKPALTLVFNALVHPPLVFCGNVCRALRDALRPLWGLLDDALAPVARLLTAARLVHVHVERRCACPHCAPA